MLVIDETAEKPLEIAKEFAKRIGKYESDSDDNQQTLKRNLDYLATYACPSDGSDPEATRCNLYKDFAPYSFGFSIFSRQKDGTYKLWMNGGLIFHGNHDRGGDGGGPTFSVNLNPVDGWSIHT